MPRSLSVFLPLHNAQAMVSARVAELLEVLADLTPRFELLLINDGSSDATGELADELARGYPQLRALHHGARLGRAGVIRTGLAATAAEWVLVCDEECRLEMRDFDKLWHARADFAAVFARPPSSTAGDASSWSRRVRLWAMRLPAVSASTARGYQLVRRQVLEALRPAWGDFRELVTELQRRGHAWHEVEVRLAKETGQPVAAARSAAPPLRIDRQADEPAPPRHWAGERRRSDARR